MPRQKGQSAIYLEDKNGQKATKYNKWWRSKFAVIEFLEGLGIHFYASLGHNKEISKDAEKMSKVLWSRLMVNAPIRVMWEDYNYGMKVARHLVGETQFNQLQRAVSETLLTLGLNPKEFNLPPAAMNGLYPQGEELRKFKKGKIEVDPIPVSNLPWAQALAADTNLQRDVENIRKTFDVREMKEAFKNADHLGPDVQEIAKTEVLGKLARMEDEVRKKVAFYVERHRRALPPESFTRTAKPAVPSVQVPLLDDKELDELPKDGLPGTRKYIESMRVDLDTLSAQRKQAEDEIRRIDRRRMELLNANELRTQEIEKLHQTLSIIDPSHESGAVLRLIQEEELGELDEVINKAGE